MSFHFLDTLYYTMVVGIAQSVQRLATGWTVLGSNPGGGDIFRTRPDRPQGPPSLLYNGYRVSFPGVKRPERGVNDPPSSSAEVKERVELYLYYSSGPPRPVVGLNLPLPEGEAGESWEPLSIRVFVLVVGELYTENCPNFNQQCALLFSAPFFRSQLFTSSAVHLQHKYVR